MSTSYMLSVQSQPQLISAGIGDKNSSASSGFSVLGTRVHAPKSESGGRLNIYKTIKSTNYREICNQC